MSGYRFLGYEPFWLRWWISMPIALTFILVAVTSEVVYYLSRVNQGASFHSASNTLLTSSAKGFSFNLLYASPSHSDQFLKVETFRIAARMMPI
jgi:hypothetical protein